MTSVGRSIQPSTMRWPSSSRTRAASVARAVDAREPRLDLERPFHEALLGDLEPGELEEALPLADAVVAHVTRVAQPVGLLGRLADEGVVADHDAARTRRAPSPSARRARRRSDARRAALRPRRSCRRRTEDAPRARSRRPACRAPGSTVTTFAPASRSRRATWPPPVATSSTLTPSAGSHQSTTRSRSSPAEWIALVRYEVGAVAPDVAHFATAPRPAWRRRASSPRDGCSACRPPRGSGGPPRRSSRRAGRRSGTSTCRAARAPRGSRARPRRSA